MRLPANIAQRLPNLPPHYLTFIGLSLYSVLLVVITGDIGFQGDDWCHLYTCYWYPFPQSVWASIESLGKVTGIIHNIPMFAVFGFWEPAYHLVGLLLLSLAAMALGACLHNIFPHRPALVGCAVMFAFFLPTLSYQTYIMTMNGAALHLLVLWISVLAFQNWTKGSQSWVGLAPPVFLYLVATAFYDAGAALILAVPLFVWPIRQRSRSGLSPIRYSVRLGVGVLAALLLFDTVRSLGLAGQHEGLVPAVPSLDLVASYLWGLVEYVLSPFGSLPRSVWTWLIGTLVLISAALLRRCGRTETAGDNEGVQANTGLRYALVLGFVVFALGILTYLVAGYGFSLCFWGGARIYCSATYGLAIVLGVVATGWSTKRLLYVTRFFAVVVIAAMAMFHADLRLDWQEASEMRDDLEASLLEQAPDVMPGTTFLLLDVQSYIDNRAAVVAGTTGLRRYIQILYDNEQVDAFFLYICSDKDLDREGRSAMASPDGVIARGSDPRKPIPLDSLLIFQRKGSVLLFLDKITASDQLAAVEWEGISEIGSNPDRIVCPSR